MHYKQGDVYKRQAYLTGIVGNDIFQYMYMLWISYTYIYHTNSCKNNAHICTCLLYTSGLQVLRCVVINFDSVLKTVLNQCHLQAVSYTHLDVYKRQVPEGSIKLEGGMESQDIFIEVGHGPTLIDNNESKESPYYQVVGNHVWDEYPTYDEWIAKMCIRDRKVLLQLGVVSLLLLKLWRKFVRYIRKNTQWRRLCYTRQRQIQYMK